MAELRVHLQFQDYELLAEEKFVSTEAKTLHMQDNPHEIANVLKEILRESTESVCPTEIFD
jgi:hypothetical protein